MKTVQVSTEESESLIPTACIGCHFKRKCAMRAGIFKAFPEAKRVVACDFFTPKKIDPNQLTLVYG